MSRGKVSLHLTRGRGLLLLLASTCEAAPGSEASLYRAALVPGATPNSASATPGHTVGPINLIQPDLGDVPLLAFPPPPPLPPRYPGAPESPPSDEPRTLCDPQVIENSNRTAAAPCMDKLSLYPVEGTECFFQCNPGYLPIGRHVCQWHDNEWLKNNTNHTDPSTTPGDGWQDPCTSASSMAVGARNCAGSLQTRRVHPHKARVGTRRT